MNSSRPLSVLWIATKPPLPTLDGGRLVMATTLDALTGVGAEVTLVAPTLGEDAADAPRGVRTQLVNTRPRRWLAASISSLQSGRPLSVERHAHTAVADRVEHLLRHETFDLVHVEQPQALAGAAPALRAGVPSVLRAQNIESAVWELAAGRRAVDGMQHGLAVCRPLWRAEARRMRRFEAAAIANVDVTIALSATDANHLSSLQPSARIVVVPPPASLTFAAAAATMPATMPAPALAGSPAFVWIGSAGWWPNEEAKTWLIESIWPAIAARLPDAQLHLFGASPRADSRVVAHAIVARGVPSESRVAFAPNATLLLPMRSAIGVRMRLLEAWGRGVPVIASPAAVEGLETADGVDLFVASDAHEFAEAAVRLAATPDLRARLIQGGRATLARRHDPAAIARMTLDTYQEAIARRLHHHTSIRASAAW